MTNLTESTDIGFMLICKILASITSDPQLMFLVTSSIINILIVNTLKKKSTSYELSMWLYITTFIYYSTFNGIRQWISASIIFAGIEFLLKRKFKRYCIIVTIAALIHASAIIMIPIYFVVNSKPFSIRNLVIISLFIGAVFLYIPFVDTLFKLLQGTQYEHYFDIMREASNGANPIRILVYLVPIVLFAIGYKNINSNKEKEIDIIFNLCILGFLTMFLAMKQVYFARLTFYFDLYYLLLIPRLIKIGNEDFKRLLYYLISICYFIYSYMLLLNGEARILPYKFIITLFK